MQRVMYSNLGDTVKTNTKTVNKRPKVVPSKAIVGGFPIGIFTNIDPTSTPVSAYIKKTK